MNVTATDESLHHIVGPSRVEQLLDELTGSDDACNHASGTVEPPVEHWDALETTDQGRPVKSASKE
jgi:hypothetical protein